MSDAINLSNKIFSDGSYASLVKLGDRDFEEDAAFAWKLAIYISRIGQFARDYEKVRNNIIKNFSETYKVPDGRGGETEVTGVKRGGEAEVECTKALEELDAQEFTLYMAKPVALQSSFGKKFNPSVLGAAMSLLDVH